MDNDNVKIVTLEPLRVASFHAYGAGPENEAAQKMIEWARSRGLLDGSGGHRVFGFDNPEPSPGSPNYGYEFWITLDPAYDAGSEASVKEFPGGLFAVLRCDVKGDAYEIIPNAWQQLAAWCESSTRYEYIPGQILEEQVAPQPFDVSDEFSLDLYLPVRERTTG